VPWVDQLAIHAGLLADGVHAGAVEDGVRQGMAGKSLVEAGYSG
jgi:hypothetical protein